MPGLTIRHEVLVRAPRRRVWDALTTREGLDGWFTQGAEVDARPGGAIRFRWREWGPQRITAEDGGPVLEAVEPERFVFRWHEDAEDPTRVTFELEEHGSGTLLRVVDEGYPDTAQGKDRFMDCAAGWGEALTLVKFWVEHGLRY